MMIDDFLVLTASESVENPDAKCIDSLPLAMAYVPMQQWRDLYSADVGLQRGTIFSQLDKPFLGRRAEK